VKVVVDTSMLRRPHTGVARWVTGLLDALDKMSELEILRADGPCRVGGGPLFRPINVARQRWWYAVGIRRVAQRWGADALLMPAGYAAGRGRTPQLLAILDVNFLTQPGTYDPLLARYAAWAMRRGARDADCLVTISASSRSEISHHLHVKPERIHVIYPGLEPLPMGDFPRLIEGPYALYVGATQSHKNIGLLIDAWPRVRDDLKLVIVGQPGRDHAHLAERAAGMGGRVLLTGRVSQEALEAWYRHATIFLFPSLTEGFGYPPLEAMQRGIPVVASNAGPLPEVLGDAAGYHDPRDSAALVDAMDAVLDNKALRLERIRKGREQAAKYTWDRAAREMVELLNGLGDCA
jgi:glycosyltransferase involved in cell wall biosynthesis